MDVAERFESLEIKVAHLERNNQELSDVIFRQQRELDELRTRLQQLGNRVESLATPDAAGDGVEIPPHY